MRGRYWMVHCPDHGWPRVMHYSLERARREAKRLARENPDRTFYVLEAVEACVKVDVRHMDLRRGGEFVPDDVPF